MCSRSWLRLVRPGWTRATRSKPGLSCLTFPLPLSSSWTSTLGCPLQNDPLGRIGPEEDWFIGGLSRAGKSTLTAVLQCMLRRPGRRCEVVRLDRWILGLDERGAGVFGRFDMAALEQVVLDVGKRAVEPAALTMPAYSRRERRRLPGTLTRTFDADTTILWDGIVAVRLAASYWPATGLAYCSGLDQRGRPAGARAGTLCQPRHSGSRTERAGGAGDGRTRTDSSTGWGRGSSDQLG